MIARVRIAPVEHWCEYAKSGLKCTPEAAQSVGQEIDIETASMSKDPICGGNRWAVTALNGWQCVDIETGKFNAGLMCQHQLEMD